MFHLNFSWYKICIVKINNLFSVVHTFSIENVSGKRIHVYDHLNTRVKDDDTLKYLLKSNTELLVMKVVFIGDNDCQNVAITSEVKHRLLEIIQTKRK